MKEIKEKNVARGRIEGAKGLRAMKPSFIHTASSIYQCTVYIFNTLGSCYILSSKTRERIYIINHCACKITACMGLYGNFSKFSILTFTEKRKRNIILLAHLPYF